MEKRGVAEGVDWIIAVGIFVVYLGLVFVFFKPGVQATVDYNDLADLVQENTLKSIEWNVTKVPIFVKPIKFKETGKDPVKKFDKGEQTSLKFVGLVTELKNLDVEYEADKISRDIALTQGDTASAISLFKAEGDDICIGGFTHTISASDYTKIVIKKFSKTIEGIESGSCGNIDKACLIEELNIKKDPQKKNKFNEDADSSSECAALYKLGSSETLVGIKIEGIATLKYSTIKNEWKFPEMKEFKVVFYSPLDLNCKSFIEAKGNMQCYIGEQEPPESANVFVREINTQKLGSNGDLTSYTMNIRIW